MSDTSGAAGTAAGKPRFSEPALEVRGVTKSFGALSVLRGVDLTLHKGEVLGLVGDNGAGKSTLVKILSGLFGPDAGHILLNGSEVHFRSVEDAISHGIETVHQDLALVPQLPVFQNLFLNHEITRLGPIRMLDKHKMRELARQYLDDINVNVPNVDTEAGQLSGGQRQAIAVARATRANASILLLDEPLAAMGARESRLIIDLVKELASSGKVSIIIIDHNYAHLFHLCDRVNVMQEGRISIDRNVEDTSLEELTELMVSSYRSQLQEASSLPRPAPRPTEAPKGLSSEQRKNRTRIGVIGGVVLAIVVAVSLALALSAHHSHKSTGPSTTTTLRVTTTTTVGPPAHKIVLAQAGSGISTTSTFGVDLTPWVLAWTYSCGTAPGNFIVTVTQNKNVVASDPVVNELGLKGSGTQSYHNVGQFNLKVTSECKWTVRVTNG